MHSESLPARQTARGSDGPLVSVLIPAYNHERYAADAIESVLNQTYRSFELFVIDDGSTDATAEIIRPLAAAHGFFFERRENRGLLPTLRELMSHARGKYINLLASDDRLYPDKLARCVAAMEQNPALGMVHGLHTTIDADGKILREAIDKGSVRLEGRIFEDLLTRGHYISAPTSFWRRSSMDAVGGYAESGWIEDWDLALRVANEFEVGFINAPLAFYRIHPQSLHTSKRLLMYHSEKAILTKWKNHPAYSNALPRYHLRWFCTLAYDHKLLALRYGFRSLGFAATRTFWSGVLRLLFGRLPEVLKRRSSHLQTMSIVQSPTTL